MKKRDYSMLRGRIKERLKNEYVLAKKMRCSKATISKKLNNETDFTQDEIEKICQILEIERKDIPSYFFTPIV
jgi:putative cro repressor